MERAMKTLQSILLLLLMAITSQAQEVNKLFVPDITGAESSTITLPVSLSNTSPDIVAMQFELSVPQDVMTLNTSSVALTERKEDHTVVASPLGNGRYRVMAYSPSNKPLKANSGEVLVISAEIAGEVDHDGVFPISLSNVVLSDSKGNNVATEPSNGTFRIKPSPDFTVSDINVSQTAFMPGDTIDVAWTVNNIGSVASTGGWSERVSLVASDGTEKSLGTFYYDTQSLGAGSAVSRSVKVALPTLLGIDGGANVKVTIVPNADSGEDIAYQKNNTIEMSGYAINVGKRLVMEVPVSAIEEGTSSPVRCMLSRSGSWNTAQTFVLTNVSGDSRLVLPESVTINQGQSSAYFYITISDNDILDNDSIFNIQVSGNDYEAVTSTLVVEDDEYPQLTLKASKSDIVEGETFQLTVTTERASSMPIVVSLVSEAPKRFSHPATITIPADETSATVEATAIDNEEVELMESIAFKVSAEKYQSGECIILLDDNDLPAIGLELSPTTVTESAGSVAIVAKLHRTTNTDKVVTIHLSDDSNGDIYYQTKSFTLDKGVEEAQFSLGVIDNAIVDGDRQVNITAAVYVSSCSCSASGTSVGVVTKTIEIIDNDGPSLSVSSSKSTLLEGNEEGIVLTVTRNTDTESALAVSISSDYDEGLSYEHNVTIPAGAKSVDVPVKALANSASSDDRTIVFTVESTDFSKGTCWVMLTDQTLPDAQITDISVSKSEAEVGSSVDVSVTISNIGAAELPEVTKIGIYVSNSSNPVANLYTQQSLASGEQVTLNKVITLPAAVGNYEIYAVANDGQAVKELLYVNNTSEKISVKTTSPFSAIVSTDKNVYQQGEAVQISGSVIGNNTTDTEVEVYIINDGLRQTLKATTDANGNFAATYQPYSVQMGHFVVGACYPEEGLTEEKTSFDVYGFKRTSNTAITCDVLLGETYTKTFTISNPGVLSLTSVKATVLSKPENCNVTITVPDAISGGSNVDVSYSLTGSAVTISNAWEQIKVLIETAEGPSLNTTLYYYCRNPKGQLQASVSSINTTMVKGTSRDYPFFITNIGKGETGKITLSLPEWMSSATPREMASLAQGDTTTVILRFTPTEAMQLNVPVTGTIGINCENGDGIPLSYSVEPVSESTGTLVVDVCDEYTYYTAEGPHVSDAQVLVKHPTTGAVIAKGLTDNNGIFSVSLPEGYYGVSVTADNHDSYTNNILVDPGKENLEEVFLGFKSITYSWDVVETEIEDEYKIITTVKYETNIPAPVIVVNLPETKPEVNDIIPIIVTNKGLITASTPSLSLDCPDEYELEILNPFDLQELAPQQTYVYYAVLKNKELSSNAKMKAPSYRSSTPCMFIGAMLTYAYICGKYEQARNAAARNGWGTCMNGFGFGGGSGGGSGGNGGGATGPGNPNNDNTNIEYSEDNATALLRNFICSTCPAALGNAANSCGLGWIPIIGCMTNVPVSCGIPAIKDDWTPLNVIGCVSSLVGCIPGPVGMAATALGCGLSLGNAINECHQLRPALTKSYIKKDLSTSPQSSSYVYILVDELDEKNSIAVKELSALQSFLINFFGSEEWLECDGEQLADFLTYIQLFCDGRELKFTNELYTQKPENISRTVLEDFIERFNNGIRYNGSAVENVANTILYDSIYDNVNIIKEQEKLAQEMSYSSVMTMWKDVYERLEEFLNDKEASSSVCASISLQLSQTMTMTRQAFRGSLTVFNGNEEKAMENVRLNLEVRDENGTLATAHEFQINAESLDGFTGNLDLTSGWSLAANETGTATILFIPTKYAALETGVDYSFGGSLSYLDPFTGLEVTRDLYPVTLTVKPSPNLDLTYFMQRDIYGDDPLTADVVEPCEPAEFALLINNKGYGDATNVRMVTNQPEIVDNEKGLLVNFELLSSQLNGKDNTLALGGSVATDFGTIPAHSTTYAQWWLQSSLLGHFTEYDIKATHVTSFGNEDLSLLDNVTIHELIHGFTVNDKTDPKVRGFLVNDIADAEDMPDMVYFTDGSQEEEVAKASVSMTRNSETEYAVTIVPSATGWSYGSTNDLTAGRQKLVSVVRQSDGVELPADNFWLTDRTLRDGKDPLYEYRLHAVAELTAEETFILTFEHKPEVELEVERFTDIPEDGEVLTTQLKSVGVKFNKAIDATTFTVDDLKLNCQGKAVDASKAVITKVSDTEFTLGLDNVTLESGYYVLTVQTSGITDYEGFTGTTGKTASWIQYADGMVTLTVKASPAEGGTVAPATGKVAYDSEVTLKAVSAEGYDFTGWKRGDEAMSDKASFDYVMTSDEEFTALFTIKHFNVDIVYDASQGIVENAASGIYDYGTVLEMRAVPSDGYKFDGWIVDNDTLSTDASYNITVKDDIVITADFSGILSGFEQNIRGKQGLSIYPLPLRETMYVNGDFNVINGLLVVDINGSARLIKTQLAAGSPIDVASLPRGIYIVKAITDNGTYIKKVYK